MITIGPQRIHHSPFAPLTARPAPRSQPSNKRPHPAASLDQQQSAEAGAMSSRSHQNGRNNGRRSNGSVSARTMDGGGACPPRFERTVREERRQSGSGMQTMQQHQHREGGGGSSAEPRNTEQKSRSLATPPAVLDGGSAAAALSENGRESRSSVSESSGSGRRQPQPSQRQQYSTRYIPLRKRAVCVHVSNKRCERRRAYLDARVCLRCTIGVTYRRTHRVRAPHLSAVCSSDRTMMLATMAFSLCSSLYNGTLGKEMLGDSRIVGTHHGVDLVLGYCLVAAHLACLCLLFRLSFDNPSFPQCQPTFPSLPLSFPLSPSILQYLPSQKVDQGSWWRKLKWIRPKFTKTTRRQAWQVKPVCC